MARLYHVAAVSIAIGCDRKWLDNVLSRTAITGISRERQGVSRRVSSEALLQLAVVHALVADLAIPTIAAIAVAERICGEEEGTCVLASGLTIRFDLTRLRRELDRRLLEASEIAVPPRRGRPPRRPPASTSDLED